MENWKLWLLSIIIKNFRRLTMACVREEGSNYVQHHQGKQCHVTTQNPCGVMPHWTQQLPRPPSRALANQPEPLAKAFLQGYFITFMGNFYFGAKMFKIHAWFFHNVHFSVNFWKPLCNFLPALRSALSVGKERWKQCQGALLRRQEAPHLFAYLCI